MCKVCTEAVHSIALWTLVTLELWACVKHVPKQSIPYHCEHGLHQSFGHVRKVYISCRKSWSTQKIMNSSALLNATTTTTTTTTTNNNNNKKNIKSNINININDGNSIAPTTTTTTTTSRSTSALICSPNIGEAKKDSRKRLKRFRGSVARWIKMISCPSYPC